MGVLPHHQNMIAAIVPGIMRYRTEDGQTHEASVSAGIAEIMNNRVKIFVLSAERAGGYRHKPGEGSQRTGRGTHTSETQPAGISSQSAGSSASNVPFERGKQIPQFKITADMSSIIFNMDLTQI